MTQTDHVFDRTDVAFSQSGLNGFFFVPGVTQCMFTPLLKIISPYQHTYQQRQQKNFAGMNKLKRLK